MWYLSSFFLIGASHVKLKLTEVIKHIISSKIFINGPLEKHTLVFQLFRYPSNK